MKFRHYKHGIKRTTVYVAFFFGSVNIFAQNWTPMVQEILYYGPNILYEDSVENYLYMSGSFTSINGATIKGIARWNGSTWDSVGTGSINDGSPIYAMARYGTDLYVGGAFANIGSIPARRLGKWNGLAWDTLSIQGFSLDQDFSNGVTSLAVIDGLLYVGGIFDSIAGQPCQSMATWNGSNWNPIGLPPEIHYDWNPRVNAICKYNSEIYVGGNFESYLPIATDTIRDIIRWDGTNWKSVGGGMRGGWTIISKMVVFQGELYVAGSFLKQEGNVGNNIQKWDGQQWTEVGGGTYEPTAMGGTIYDMFLHNNKLYVTGYFLKAGGIPANDIAIWDGTNWCGLGSTFDNNVVATGAFYNDTLVVGGGFWTIDGDTILRVAKWLGGNYVDQCGNNIGLEEEGSFEVEINPNPTKDKVTIYIPELNNTTLYSIFNMVGEKIEAGLIIENNIQIDLINLPDGLYIIEIISGNKKVCKKLLKLN